MNFEAELKRSSQRKTASLDNVYQVVFETDNPMVLDLGKLPPDTLFRVNIEIDDDARNRNEVETGQTPILTVGESSEERQRAENGG